MEYLKIQGATVPVIGLGTWALRGKKCTETIHTALELGYRHIDTAQMYGNESAIGKALAETTVPREEIFLTTKIMESNLRHENVLRSVQGSLRQIQTDYADLLLIHWPNRSVPISETIQAMNTLQDDGMVKHIGVSNFSVSQIRKAQDASGTPILTNQVEFHPLREQQAILEYCMENNLILTAYSPLAKGRVTRNSTLADIGRPYGKTPAQIALRWLIQQKNVAAIPKASGREHLEQNLDVFDFELSPDEVRRIRDLGA